MSHTVSVDLSAKVEQWSKNTAIVFSNEICGSILVSKKVKKQARDWSKIRYPKQQQAFYQYVLFAAFIYLLVRPYVPRIRHLAIDLDYPGEHSIRRIKDFLLEMLRRDQPGLRGTFISFREVKGTQADKLARHIFEQQKPADRRIHLNEVQTIFGQ
jgi:hypothetical protein